MNFDENSFKDEIELMNIQRQIKQNQSNNSQTVGFNLDTIYNEIENIQNNL